MLQRSATEHPMRKLGRALMVPPKFVLRLPVQFKNFFLKYWNYGFKDFRVIVEQEAELKYFYVTCRTQQWVARSTFMAVMVLTGLLSHQAWLMNRTQQLEASHQQVYAALMDVSGIKTASELDDDGMVSLATRIRQRDAMLMEYVNAAESMVLDQNSQLKEKLLASGMDARHLETPKAVTGGGLPQPMDEQTANLFIHSHAIEQLDVNRHLKGIYESLPTHFPIDSYQATSSYGFRVHPVTGRPDFHPGMDLVPNSDMKVRATMDGVVAQAGPNGSYGNTVIIKHANDIKTLYAHLAAVKAKVGEAVSKNDVIGIVGNTGLSTGTHLHYEVLVDGKPVNPKKLITGLFAGK